MSPIQIPFSPYYGPPDFAKLAVDGGIGSAAVDKVSIADILRNAFIYPPHSIFEGVKLVTYGFQPDGDMDADPKFKFKFKFRSHGTRKNQVGDSHDWVASYHRMLCDAVSQSCAEMRSPWLLQSGGKDSTSIAIAAADARPDMACITYLGGREENEVASARSIAKKLGLRHEALVCDPGRAYDRYLAMVGRMPSLTADFAVLSYADLITDISTRGGDGVIDGLGSDVYFGTLVGAREKALEWLAKSIRLPDFVSDLPLINRSFKLSFALATMQMGPVERVFPGSRFTDAEVDALLGEEIAHLSKQRLAPFMDEIAAAKDLDERRAISLAITEPMEAFAKGLYTTAALSMKIGYPYCDSRLRNWVQNEVPGDLLMDQRKRLNKVLVRRHIGSRFGQLEYVSKKGSFRFDLRGLAAARFDQVHDYAQQMRDWLPGAAPWLQRNRHRLDNKYHASKFYLLAVVLPWLATRGRAEARALSDPVQAQAA